MNIITQTYRMYIDGFKNMTVGKTLWKIVFIKLLVILVFLKFFVHDKTFKTEYQTFEAKSEFVSNNLQGR
ncbi:DUF4492 domain-containing protein [Arcobacter sp. FWKO B]|uniref:DUF4492 domain-containing protein n=1 Tax=Arcobacter sp. FWKO B TaxID=2593672 RepID=UPI0018A6A5EA|nr:DUF4492 domain-containing protein [Arcobacter sp. FWKO B]QOG11897.1 DUF4492 domain-containing protein [Arcobacter sp. FWKO B]